MLLDTTSNGRSNMTARRRDELPTRLQISVIRVNQR
jgi:hypothetical protein